MKKKKTLEDNVFISENNGCHFIAASIMAANTSPKVLTVCHQIFVNCLWPRFLVKMLLPLHMQNAFRVSVIS